MTHSDLSVNIAEPDSGATPLMLASIIGHMEMVKLLINQGAGTDLNTKDFVYGWTALMQATFYGHQEVTKYLLKCGADPTIQGIREQHKIFLKFLLHYLANKEIQQTTERKKF